MTVRTPATAFGQTPGMARAMAQTMSAGMPTRMASERGFSWESGSAGGFPLRRAARAHSRCGLGLCFFGVGLPGVFIEVVEGIPARGARSHSHGLRGSGQRRRTGEPIGFPGRGLGRRPRAAGARAEPCGPRGGPAAAGAGLAFGLARRGRAWRPGGRTRAAQRRERLDRGGAMIGTPRCGGIVAVGSGRPSADSRKWRNTVCASEKAGDREERAGDLEEVLADEQREHHEDRVDLRRVADDLRVQEVRLELVDAHDPREHAEPPCRATA